MILSLILVLCFTVGCQDKEAMAELETMRAQTKVEGQNIAILNRMSEAWAKGNFEAYKDMLAPEFVYYQPANNTQSMSLEESIEFGKMVQNAFPDITVSIEEFIAEEKSHDDGPF